MQPIFQPAADGQPEIARLLEEARGHFAKGNSRKAIDVLHAAQQMAAQVGRHGEASQLRRAISILASGGRPKLLGSRGSFKTAPHGM